MVCRLPLLTIVVMHITPGRLNLLDLLQISTRRYRLLPQNYRRDFQLGMSQAVPISTLKFAFACATGARWRRDSRASGCLLTQSLADQTNHIVLGRGQ